MEDFIFYNPKKRFIEKVFGPLFQFLLDHHISPVIIPLIIVIFLCIKFRPYLKNKDGKLNDYIVMLIAVTIIGIIGFIYSQVDLIIKALK